MPQQFRLQRLDAHLRYSGAALPQRLYLERGLLGRQADLRHGEERMRRLPVERRLPGADPFLLPQRGVRELPAEQRLFENPGDALLQPGSNAVHPVPLEERLPCGPDVQSGNMPLRPGGGSSSL